MNAAHGGRSLTREQITALLHELSGELAARGVQGQLFLVGGAAIALAYDTRRMTGDLDGVFQPKQVVYDAAKRVAARHPDLPEDWLNDAVMGLLPPGAPRTGEVVIDEPGLRVCTPPAEYLLALKVQAARVGRDQDDIRFLAHLVGARTADDVLTIAEHIIGADTLLPKAQFMVQEMFPEAAAERRQA